MSDLYGQFADKWAYAEVRAKEELIEKVSVFRDELVKNVKDENSFEKLLEVKGWKLFTMYSNGAALLELLRLLESNPHLAMKVIDFFFRLICWDLMYKLVQANGFFMPIYWQMIDNLIVPDGITKQMEFLIPKLVQKNICQI